MARTRRRRKGTWFPNLGTAGPGEDIDDDDLGIWGQLNLPAVGAAGNYLTQSIILPLTFDATEEDNLDEATDRLGDIIGSEYMLRRIVGSLYVSRSFDRGLLTTSYPGVKVSAGFFVARQADSSQSLDRPIGAETASELRENYSPSQAAIVREPWIWRRTWLLGNSAFGLISSIGATPGVLSWPLNNMAYNGALTNEKVDAKTIRHVRQDERTWFVIAARGIGLSTADPFVNNTGSTSGSTTVEFHLDYRMFGSLMKAKQRGAF